MAKVTMPLMSASASGRFAGNIVFDKRGRVREFVAPVQPNTPAQVAARGVLGSVAKAVGMISETAPLAALRSALTYQWFAAFLGACIRNRADALIAYNALSIGERQNWLDGGEAAMLPSVDDISTSGFTLWLIAFSAGDAHVEGSPAAVEGNSGAVATYFFGIV